MSENDKNKSAQQSAAADPATPPAAATETTPPVKPIKAKPQTSPEAGKSAGSKPKAGGSTTKAPEGKSQTPPAEKSKYSDLVAKYSKLYPGNDTFHITTDSQVFLSKNLSAAQNHQRTIGEGEVITIKVK